MLVVRLAHVATAIEDQTREADSEQHERGGHGNRGQANIIDEDRGGYRSFCNFPHSKARRKCSGTRQGKRDVLPFVRTVLEYVTIAGFGIEYLPVAHINGTYTPLASQGI